MLKGLYMFKPLLAMALLIFSFAPLALPMAEAHAMNVKCNDPQTERGKVRTMRETKRYQRGELVERTKTGNVENPGRMIISPEKVDRDESYEPKPIKEGSNLHECVN